MVPRICLALVLFAAVVHARGERTENETEQKPPEKIRIGVLAGLARPEAFIVEDARPDEMKVATPFRQTYKAPFSPFSQPVPLAKFQRGMGDAEFNVAPIDLLVEKLIERYGEELKGKRLKVHEFSYQLEQVVNKQQGVVFIPLDPASVVIAVVGTAAGTALMHGKGIDLRLSVKIDAELDGQRIEAAELPVTMGMEDGPARVTRFAIEKFIYRLDQPKSN